MRKSRMPKIGDLIVQRQHSLSYIGLVREIIRDKYGHQRNVYIEWAGNSPPVYREEHGYDGINIHNCRQEFDVIRKGISIP
jgi:hypothetical protein|tara:strand:+ start:2913 stop:3155 length:243 start_codon:yes stop_codon:yes gene_type:complete